MSSKKARTYDKSLASEKVENRPRLSLRMVLPILEQLAKMDWVIPTRAISVDGVVRQGKQTSASSLVLKMNLSADQTVENRPTWALSVDWLCREWLGKASKPRFWAPYLQWISGKPHGRKLFYLGYKRWIALKGVIRQGKQTLASSVVVTRIHTVKNRRNWTKASKTL